MAVETDADRAIFLDPGDFGVEAVYTAARTGATVTVAGIFDAESSTFDPSRWMGGPEWAQQQGAQISGTGPRFECQAFLLPDGGKQGSRLVVHGKTYSVHDPKPDGTGMVVLILMEDD